MRIMNKYSVDLSPKLLSLLDQNGIPYKLSTNFNPPIISFHLYSDDIRKDEIEAQLTSRNLVIPELIFSKSEYENATWFRFMPTKDKIPSCESPLTYSYFCKKADGTVDYDTTHRHQIGYYRLSKTPRWQNEKCVLSAEGDYNYIWFTNDATRTFLERMDIRGFRFDPVLCERDGQPLADIYQIMFDHTMPEEAIAPGKEHGIRSVVTCDSCGEKRYYVCPHTYQLCLYNKYLGDQDVYITQSTFGQGFGYHIVIVSKKFYRVIKENALDKFFKIHPIKVISEE